MIKLGLLPAFTQMTNFATILRHTDGKLPGMFIGMTSGATLLRKDKKQLASECARSLTCVARGASCSQVGALQSKGNALMLGHGET